MLVTHCSENINFSVIAYGNAIWGERNLTLTAQRERNLYSDLWNIETLNQHDKDQNKKSFMKLNHAQQWALAWFSLSNMFFTNKFPATNFRRIETSNPLQLIKRLPVQ